MSIIKNICSIPPPANRHLLFSFAINQASAKDCDDVYVLYLVFCSSLFITLFLCLLNLLSHAMGMAIGFGIFVINLSGANYVQTFVHQYTIYASTILLFLILPYYFLVFKSNIDLETWKPSWGIQNNLPIPATRRQLWETLIFGIFILIVAMYGAYGLFAMFLTAWHFENSFGYFLICALLFSISLSFCNMLILRSVMAYWWRLSRSLML